MFCRRFFKPSKAVQPCLTMAANSRDALGLDWIIVRRVLNGASCPSTRKVATAGGVEKSDQSRCAGAKITHNIGGRTCVCDMRRHQGRSGLFLTCRTEEPRSNARYAPCAMRGFCPFKVRDFNMRHQHPSCADWQVGRTLNDDVIGTAKPTDVECGLKSGHAVEGP